MRTRCLPPLLLLLLLVAPAGFHSLGAAETQTTSWSIKGAGWLKNRTLKRQVQAVFPEQEVLRSNDIEDAVLVLLALLQREGFLNARIQTTAYPDPDADPVVTDWSLLHDTILEEESNGYSKVEFRLFRGPVFYYSSLEIGENGGLSYSWIESFFYPPPLLFQGARSRIYSPDALQRSARNLESYLSQRGYQQARVRAEVKEIDENTGAVSVHVDILRGPLHRLVSVEWETPHPLLQELDLESLLQQPFSRELRQDLVRMVRNRFFEDGFADVEIQSRISQNQSDDEVSMTLHVRVDGLDPLVTGEVSFHGLNRTSESFLRSKINIHPGELFNPVRVDQSRLKLAQTGLFSQIRVHTEDNEIGERDLQFFFAERYPWTLDLMVGWGTWEMARGGLMVERSNLWGSAQQVRLSSILSMRSFLTESRYLIPDVWNSGVAVSSRLFTLDRQEFSFDRKERGFDVAATRRFERARLDSALLYTLEKLRSDERQDREVRDTEKTQSASLSLRLSHDARDSPILPRHGYRIYGTFQWASELLGGDHNYQVAELGFGQHHHMGSGLHWHLGINLGTVFTEGSSSRFIPKNKLFFLGGDHSIRGYQRGQAAPLDEDGFLVGARTYTTINFELEQYLSKDFSIVAFYDWGGMNTSSQLFNLPERLHSIGLGLRFRTPMGPLRLEYGHNLRVRPSDPRGTLHFALGFPF